MYETVEYYHYHYYLYYYYYYYVMTAQYRALAS